MTFAFTVSATIPATPKAIYDAWLDGKQHGSMNGGGKAWLDQNRRQIHRQGRLYQRQEPRTGTGKRIVQSWRTTQFTDKDADSQITVTLARVAGGTKVTLRHANVPDGHDGYKSGWKTHYFEPMKAYFGARPKRK